MENWDYVIGRSEHHRCAQGEEPRRRILTLLEQEFAEEQQEVLKQLATGDHGAIELEFEARMTFLIGMKQLRGKCSSTNSLSLVVWQYTPVAETTALLQRGNSRYVLPH